MRCNSPSSLRRLGPDRSELITTTAGFSLSRLSTAWLLTSKVISARADIALARRIGGASTNASGHSTAHIHPTCIPRHA
jgi:hypothetical protein